MPALNLAPDNDSTRPMPSEHDLLLGLASDRGRVRDENQDNCLAWHLALTQEGQCPQSVGLLILADGMGGLRGGALASALACRIAAGHITRQIYLPMFSEDSNLAERAPINEVLESAVGQAHDSVRRRFPDAGTTLSVALLLGDAAYMAHVGDSRIYLGQRGHLAAVTRDHSMSARLLEISQATAPEAALRRNMLYRAVGQGPTVTPDVLYRDLPWGHYLLICCDGLWTYLSDTEIALIVEASPTPDLACQELVARANARGGDDNISVVLAARGWPLPDPGTRT